MCAPVHVSLPVSAGQTGNVQTHNNSKWEWALLMSILSDFKAKMQQQKSRNAPDAVFPANCFVLLSLPHALKCIHKNGHWTRHWNYTAHGPKQIPDTRNNARLYETRRDTKVRLQQHWTSHYMIDGAVWGPSEIYIREVICVHKLLVINTVFKLQYGLGPSCELQIPFFFFILTHSWSHTLTVLHKQKAASKPACIMLRIQHICCLYLAVYLLKYIKRGCVLGHWLALVNRGRAWIWPGAGPRWICK